MVLSLLIHPREKMWKALFMTEKDDQGRVWPFAAEGADRGLTAESGGEQVRVPYPRSLSAILRFFSYSDCFNASKQDWSDKVAEFSCPAPLPKGAISTRLA
jgi:hypothetical protein